MNEHMQQLVVQLPDLYLHFKHLNDIDINNRQLNHLVRLALLCSFVCLLFNFHMYRIAVTSYESVLFGNISFSCIWCALLIHFVAA